MDFRSRLEALKSESGFPPASHAEPVNVPALRPLDFRLRRASVGPRRLISDQEVAERLKGEEIADGLVVVERTLPLDTCHGTLPLSRLHDSPLPLLTGGAPVNINGLLFLDTETTGLAGGTGTLVFLLGLGRVEGRSLRLRQLFLTGFRGEGALLDLALDWIRVADRLVTFNGKCFDIPLLATRYLLARLPDPFSLHAHLDLLHPTRRAYARRWPNCRLRTAEERLLGFARSDDLPGHLVPAAWRDFVDGGDFARLPAVLEHNGWDVVSLAALAPALAEIYGEPGLGDADPLTVARALAREGAHHMAHRHLARCAESGDVDGLRALADFCRRHARWDEAASIWKTLADGGCAASLERLAKYYEHVARDAAHALACTEALLARDAENPELLRRRARLARISGRSR